MQPTLLLKKTTPDTHENFLTTSFVYNKGILIGGKMIELKVLLENNITFINQLRRDERYLTFGEFQQKFNLTNVNYLTYFSMLSAIKKGEKRLKNVSIPYTNKGYQCFFKAIMMTNKGCSNMYKILIQYDNIPNGVKKWEYLNNGTRWKQCFITLKNVTKDTTLLWLQYRILHNILTTNRSVSKYNKNQTERCSFCQAESETITHLLWQCPRVKSFWKSVGLMASRCNIECADKLNETSVMYGIQSYVNKYKVLELMILLGKQYIYNSKVFGNTLHINTFIQIMFNRYKIEASMNSSKELIDKFNREWEPFTNLFKGLFTSS